MSYMYLIINHNLKLQLNFHRAIQKLMDIYRNYTLYEISEIKVNKYK